jgi:hypothetical protein
VSLSGAGARRKGHDYEREVARIFAEVFGPERVRRGLQYRDGADAPDVVTPVFWVECKRGKRTEPKAALKQALEASLGKGLWPIAVCKDDKAPPIVTMHLEDFLELVREWWRTKGA